MRRPGSFPAPTFPTIQKDSRLVTPLLVVSDSFWSSGNSATRNITWNFYAKPNSFVVETPARTVPVRVKELGN